MTRVDQPLRLKACSDTVQIAPWEPYLCQSVSSPTVYMVPTRLVFTLDDMLEPAGTLHAGSAGHAQGFIAQILGGWNGQALIFPSKKGSDPSGGLGERPDSWHQMFQWIVLDYDTGGSGKPM